MPAKRGRKQPKPVAGTRPPAAGRRTPNAERRKQAASGQRPAASGQRPAASGQLPIIAITIGDPAGVGPEIALKAAADRAVLKTCRPVLVGSRAVLLRVAKQLKLRVPKDVVDPTPEFAAVDVVPGTVQAANGAAAARWVEAAIDGCRDGRFAAMVTCPLNKEALAAGGVPFPGHTELLAHRCGVSGEIMLMYDRAIAVALVTVHQAYTSVVGSLSVERIVHTGELLADALRRLRKGEPRIAVLGLNPHAGEHGLFGDEEARFVEPAVAELRRRGVTCDGPLPPDTAFSPAKRRYYAGHVCLYHDQGLIPFKALAFDDGVNVTLGLPIVRTSVDHGTAFDIAWLGKATHRSLISAISLAVTLSTREDWERLVEKLAPERVKISGDQRIRPNRVNLFVVDRQGQLVYSKQYTYHAFYDGAHGWDSSKWNKKIKAYEALFIYTEEDGSIDRMGLLRYGEDGVVIGEKQVDRSGVMSFSKGIFAQE